MKITIKGRLLCDLELLLNGAFDPLEGFLIEKDYYSVIENMRLSNGKVWPIPIIFPINEDEKQKINLNDKILLVDETNLPLARLNVEDIYKPNVEKECKYVLGSNDKNHPFHNEIMKNKENFYIGGKLEKINLPFHFDFKEIRRTPDEVKQLKIQSGLDLMVGFQTRNPMHKCHFELVKYASNEIRKTNKDKKVGALIHPVVGITQDCDIDYHSRVRCYKKIIPHFENNSTLLSLLPLSMRMAGPREALLHAIVRKNYGCTHFIVGRDHAGPSYKKENGESFYGPYDSHQLIEKFGDEIGIKVVMSKMIMYVEELGEYRNSDNIPEGMNVKHISGTQQRKLLKEGKDIPEWFSFPEVVKELKQVYKPNNQRGFCIYLIGLSGSGKSVLTSHLNSKLLGIESQRKITILDGDIVRQNLSSGLGFSKEDRSKNVRRIGFVAKEVVKHGGICICSNIAPYQKDREINRQLIENYGGYFEIYINTPLSKCEERDCKGLYKLAREGKIKQFTGISDPFEQPINADLNINNSHPDDIQKNLTLILDLLKKSNYI
jgi:sulfate adenylyltransferase